MTKHIRVAADVFVKRVFKGNTVTDRDSAPSDVHKHADCRRIQITIVIVFVTVIVFKLPVNNLLLIALRGLR